MRKLRILVLMHEELVPPRKIQKICLATAEWATEYEVLTTLREMGHEVKAIGVYDDLKVIQKSVEEWKPDIIFNLLEGFKGETAFEQNLVAYLELLGLPYTGCNPQGLMLARDKGLFKIILSYHRILVPEFAVFPMERSVERPISLEFPLIVKSISEDASIGLSQASVVKNDHELEARVAFVHKLLKTAALVERYIEGREFYVGILGYEQLKVFPVWELMLNKMPKKAWHFASGRVKWNTKYQKKYEIKFQEAKNLNQKMLETIKGVAKRVYQILGLSGYARIDLRFDHTGGLYVLEANPNPDIDRDEAFSDSAKRMGWSYPILLQHIIDMGLS